MGVCLIGVKTAEDNRAKADKRIKRACGKVHFLNNARYNFTGTRIAAVGKHTDNAIGRVCEDEGCGCEERGIFLSSLLHTLKIFGFIVAVTFITNNIVFFVGEDSIGGAMKNIPVLGEFISGLIGLIPNCASSVVLTELYLDGIITSGQLLSGLFVGAGIGIPVLFRTNKNLKENLLILLAVYLTGVALGILIGETGLAAILGI
jgi:hypothetical protein